jgi:hypothetical protein
VPNTATIESVWDHPRATAWKSQILGGTGKKWHTLRTRFDERSDRMQSGFPPGNE